MKKNNNYNTTISYNSDFWTLDLSGQLILRINKQKEQQLQISISLWFF